MTKPGKIIFLHGASSSGKSTLARALQARIEEPFWHISIDHLRDSGVLPTARFKAGDFDWRTQRPLFFEGYHRSLAAYAASGNNLILEHILEEQAWLGMLARLFQPFDVFFVGVHCSRETLVRRELHRGDRPIGSAAQDFDRIHVGKRYDFEVHSEMELADIVDNVLRAWRARRAPLVFARLAEEQARKPGM